MRSLFYLAGVVLTVLVVPQLQAQVATPAVPPAVAIAPARPTWEYKELSRSGVEKLAVQGDKSPFNSGLNQLGAEGWELLVVEPSFQGREAVYLFKRPVVRKGVPAKLEPAQLKELTIVRLKHTRASELAKTIGGIFRREGAIEVVGDDASNCIILRGVAEQIKEVTAVINELDKESAPKPPKKGD